MKVLWYLAVPIFLVAAYCVVMWFRNRKPTSLQSGVDSFRKEMEALAPDGADEPRHGPFPAGSSSRRAEPSPRRP